MKKDTKRSSALEHVASIERAAEIVTEGTAMFSPEQLAGQYAHEACKEADSGDCTNASEISAHLDFLKEAGAQFDQAEAMTYALTLSTNQN